MSSIIKTRVYYEDTDAGGVVYYANYLKYLERGRTELLRTLTLSQQELLKQNIAFVVKNVDIEYQSPAKLDDELFVKTTIANCKKASIIFHQKIMNKDQNIVAAKVVVACVNLLTFLPMKMPEIIIKNLNCC